MAKCGRASAMVPLAPAAGAPLLTGAVLCAVSFVASARPMAIQLPKLPKITLPKAPDLDLPKLQDLGLPKLPKLPQLDLPNFGKKGAAPKKKKAPVRSPASTGGKVRVRAASNVTPTSVSDNAPTLADLTGRLKQTSIEPGAGWKRFPSRRMPGANMDSWKKIAKEITPEV